MESKQATKTNDEQLKYFIREYRILVNNSKKIEKSKKELSKVLLETMDERDINKYLAYDGNQKYTVSVVSMKREYVKLKEMDDVTKDLLKSRNYITTSESRGIRISESEVKDGR